MDDERRLRTARMTSESSECVDMASWNVRMFCRDELSEDENPIDVADVFSPPENDDAD